MWAPSTTLGRFALLAMAAFLGLMALFAVLVASGQRGGEQFFDNLVLTLPVLVAFASAVSAALAGAVAVVTRGERSVAVIGATIIGLAVLIFGVMEIAFPH